MLSDRVHAISTTSAATLPSGIIIFPPLSLFILSIVTAFFVSNDAREQCANAVSGATVALPVYDVLARLDSCGLGGFSGQMFFEILSRFEYTPHPNFQNRRNAVLDSPRLVQA